MHNSREPESEDVPIDSDSASSRARSAVEAACRLALEIFDSEHNLPAKVAPGPSALEELTGLRIRDRGHGFTEVIESIRRLVLATPSSAGRRFDNQLFGGRDPIASLAEMLTPILNTSMYTYKVAGPQVLAEREVLHRLADKIGFANGEGVVTPGGSIGNLVAMTVARNERRPACRDSGLTGAALTAYTSEHGHYSIRKNAGILGIGRYNVREVPVDRAGGMRVHALAELIETDRSQGHEPFFVNATAGTTVLGAFDPLADLADLTRKHGLWLHVDGALGGSLLLSATHRGLLRGCESADSFAWNAHKMMGVPLPCSTVLFQRRGLCARSFNEVADYLFPTQSDDFDPGHQSIQCGRRNDILKLWCAWAYHGDSGYAKRLDHLVDLASYAARQIRADPKLKLVTQPESINVCLEVIGLPSEAICDRLDLTCRLKIGSATIFGRQVIRMVCVNPDFEEPDIDLMLAEIKNAAASLA